MTLIFPYTSFNVCSCWLQPSYPTSSLYEEQSCFFQSVNIVSALWSGLAWDQSRHHFALYTSSFAIKFSTAHQCPLKGPEYNTITFNLRGNLLSPLMERDCLISFLPQQKSLPFFCFQHDQLSLLIPPVYMSSSSPKNKQKRTGKLLQDHSTFQLPGFLILKGIDEYNYIQYLCLLMFTDRFSHFISVSSVLCSFRC